MSTPISALRILPAEIQTPEASFPETGESSFGDTLRDAMDEMGHVQSQASTQVSSLLEGNGADVHTALIAVEKADLSFQLMLQVRNKIVSAYQEISRMQF